MTVCSNAVPLSASRWLDKRYHLIKFPVSMFFGVYILFYLLKTRNSYVCIRNISIPYICEPSFQCIFFVERHYNVCMCVYSRYRDASGSIR